MGTSPVLRGPGWSQDTRRPDVASLQTRTERRIWEAGGGVWKGRQWAAHVEVSWGRFPRPT